VVRVAANGGGLMEWVGLVVVVQNIVGSLFNSFLFDFTDGWLYVVGVGVAGGIALEQRAAKGPNGDSHKRSTVREILGIRLANSSYSKKSALSSQGSDRPLNEKHQTNLE
jgi:hypothetical protein